MNFREGADTSAHSSQRIWDRYTKGGTTLLELLPLVDDLKPFCDCLRSRYSTIDPIRPRRIKRVYIVQIGGRRIWRKENLGRHE